MPADDTIELLESLRLFLEASPLVPLFKHSASAPKFWADEAPVGTPLPYLVYHTPEGEYTYETGTVVGVLEDTEFQVSIFASTKQQARFLRARAMRVINDAPLPLSNGDVVFYLRGRRLGGMKDPELGPGQVDVFQEILMFHVFVDRTL